MPGIPLLLINPYSGKCKANQISSFYTTFFKSNIKLESRTKHYFMYNTFIEDLLSINGINNIWFWMIFGGDGTINEIIQSTYLNSIEIKNIALVPTGTGNGLAKNLGLDYIGNSKKKNEKQLTNLINSIHTDKTKDIPLWNVYCNDKKKNRISLLAQTYGVVSDLSLWKPKYKWLGHYRFVLSSLYYTLFPIYYSCIIEFEDEKGEKLIADSNNLLWFCALNQPYICQELQLVPTYKYSDEYLHLFFIDRKISLWKRCKLCYYLCKNRFSELDFVEYYRVKSYSLNTNKKGTIMIDGEVIDTKNIKVTNTGDTVRFYYI